MDQIFVMLEKAFNKVSMSVIQGALKWQEVPKRHVAAFCAVEVISDDSGRTS